MGLPVRKTSTLIVVVGLLLSACGGGASKPDETLFPQCLDKPAKRPSKIVLACIDWNYYVDHVKWYSVGPREATGSGTAFINDCNPYCSEGTFEKFAVDVKADSPKSFGTRRVFDRITLIFVDDPARAPEVSDNLAFAAGLES